MPIFAYGINHKTAPIAIREKLAFNAEQTPIFLRELMHHNAVNEAVLVTTCNRTEIYSTTPSIHQIQDWFHYQSQKHHVEITPFCYGLEGIDAVRHLMRVASGLDSMVLGEPEIFGQIKQAYRIACESGTVGHYLKHLFPAVFAASKQVRNQTDIGKNPISMAYAIVLIAKRIFSKIENCKVLLIGAGQICELIATHLSNHGINKLIIANRSLHRAQQLAQLFQGQAIRNAEIPQHMRDVDIVISATTSDLPIIGKGMIETALKNQKRHPLFMVDLAVPRDIEPEVGQIEDVYLYNIDDLQHIIRDGLKHREEAAKHAETMIELQAQNFMQKLRLLDTGTIIHNFRSRMEILRNEELSKALLHLQQGHDPRTILHTMSYNLMNKILHEPTVKLREALAQNQMDVLLLAKELFDL